MLFTTGNLITLGIVAVVLLVYRQLDRDNRSLEKVKKFADRLCDPRPLDAAEHDESFHCFDTEDFRIGSAAFLAKARPDFVGR